MGYGTVCGWPSAAFLVLQSDNSPLETGILTLAEASWVGSIMCIGGLIGNLFFGMLANRFGRKRSLVFAGVPLIVFVQIYLNINLKLLRSCSADRMAADHLRYPTDALVRLPISVRLRGQRWLLCDAYVCDGNIGQQVILKFLTVTVELFNSEF